MTGDSGIVDQEQGRPPTPLNCRLTGRRPYICFGRLRYHPHLALPSRRGTTNGGTSTVAPSPSLSPQGRGTTARSYNNLLQSACPGTEVGKPDRLAPTHTGDNQKWSSSFIRMGRPLLKILFICGLMQYPNDQGIILPILPILPISNTTNNSKPGFQISLISPC